MQLNNINLFSIFNLKTNKTSSNFDSLNPKPSEVSSIPIVENKKDNDPANVYQNEQNYSLESTSKTTDLGDIHSGPVRPKLQV